MKRRGWLIVGGLALLWLFPFLIFMGKGAWSAYWKADYDRRGEAWAKRMKENIKYDAVTDEDRRKWREQAERERIEQEAERDRKRNEYLASPINIPPRWGGTRMADDDEDSPRKVVVVVKRDPLEFLLQRQEPIYQQPDLSGMYYQRQIVGPNAGSWSINYINGPN